jgi:integrase
VSPKNDTTATYQPPQAPVGASGGNVMKKKEQRHRFTTPSGIAVSIVERPARGWFLDHRAPWMQQSDRRLLSKDSRDAAVRVAVEVVEDLYRKHARGPTPRLITVASELIAHKEREGRAKDYRRKIKEHLKGYIAPELGADTPVGDITSKQLVAFRHKLAASDLDHETCNRILVSARQILKYAEEAGYITAPALPRNFRTPPWKARERWQILEPSDIAKLLKLAPEDVRPILGYVANTGLRIGSALLTERAWIDLERHTVTYPASAMKGRHRHTVDLNAPAERCLREALARGGEQPFPFSYWYLLDRWMPLRVAFGRPTLRIHDLRHSFISNQLAAGTPVHVVQQMAAHRSLAVTALYAHSSDEARRAAASRVQIEPAPDEVEDSTATTVH